MECRGFRRGHGGSFRRFLKPLRSAHPCHFCCFCARKGKHNTRHNTFLASTWELGSWTFCDCWLECSGIYWHVYVGPKLRCVLSAVVFCVGSDSCKGSEWYRVVTGTLGPSLNVQSPEIWSKKGYCRHGINLPWSFGGRTEY